MDILFQVWMDNLTVRDFFKTFVKVLKFIEFNLKFWRKHVEKEKIQKTVKTKLKPLSCQHWKMVFIIPIYIGYTWTEI